MQHIHAQLPAAATIQPAVEVFDSPYLTYGCTAGVNLLLLLLLLLLLHACAVRERDLQSLTHPNLTVVQAVVTSIDTQQRVGAASGQPIPPPPGPHYHPVFCC
jgi:hypothetical protein